MQGLGSVGAITAADRVELAASMLAFLNPWSAYGP